MQLNIQNSQLLITNNQDKYDVNVLFSFEHKLLENAQSKFPDINLVNGFVKMDKPGNIFVQNGQIICSLGRENEFNFEKSLVSLKSLVNFLKENAIDNINIVLESILINYIDEYSFYEKTIFHILNFCYYFDEFKTKKHQVELTQINFETQASIKEYINNAISMAQSVFLLRDLANKPANIATPSYIASRVSEFDRLNQNITVKILNKKDIEAEQMNAFLAVSQGSIEEPKFVVLEYLGAKQKQTKPVVLIGKGITFDSGGISLKPSINMDSMKYDMCGAATVIALFEASVKLNLDINLIVLVPLCENMPSGSAIKPGDVIKTMSGQTVEILNTDAEGRLILCDALTYAKRYDPELVIDIATLTGGCITALGTVASAIYSNSSQILARFIDASCHSLDSTWNLPLFKEYHKMLDSKTADIANIASWKGHASSPTAACFLEKFVDYKWVHLDIAGVADGESKFNPIGYTGATGRPFYMLIEYLRTF